jgi:tRNA-splicing endonuclease subunit Sen54
MPAGHSIALKHPDPEKRAKEKKASPYQIFFNLYKPSTPFKRSAPPQPDFQIVVIK